MRLISWTIRILAFLLLLAFAAKNTHPAELQFYFGLVWETPLIALLRPGILKILGSNERQFVVRGGFAEVNPTGLTVLADFAVAVEDLDRDVLVGQIKDLEEDVADAPEGHLRDNAAQRLDQLKAVQTALGH